MLKKVLMLLSLAILAGFMWANVTIFNECVPTFSDLPANWTSNNGGGQTIYQSASNGYLLVDHIEDWVITSAYDLSSYSNVELSLAVATYGSGTNNPLTIDVSNDNGVTWNHQSFVTQTPTTTTYISGGVFAITGNHSQVRFRFRRNASSGKGVRFRSILLQSGEQIPAPTLSISPSTLQGFSYQYGYGPSTAQSFIVQGNNLTGNVNLIASSDYRISQNAQTGFTSSISLVPQNGSVNNGTIFVRLAEGLIAGTYNGNVQISSPDAQTQELTLSGTVTEPQVAGDYFVDFEGEGETKVSYASGTVSLSGIPWNLTEVLIGDLAADVINGIKVARFRGYGASAMTMLEDKSGGIGTLSFLYKAYSTDPQVSWRAEYSIDGGITWAQAGADFIAPENDEIQTFSAQINTATSGRIRIISAQTGGSSNARMNLDDISITDYSGSSEPQIAVNPAILTGFDYNEGFGPSAAQTFALTAMFVTADIVVSASANYEISLDGADYHQQIFLSPQNGTVSQPIYVRLKANLLTGSYPGNVVCDSPEAGSISVSLSGTVSTFTIPDAPLALAATEITSSSFKANWQAGTGATSYRLDVYTTTSAGGFDDLIISEYIEGTGNNKALEIFNGTGSTVSLTDYAVQIFSNGASNPSFNINLGGNLPNGDVYVLAHASANPDILSEADYTNAYAISFNGDDAVAIYNTSTGQYVDIFGVIGNDPGTAWTAAGGYSTLDKTLVRRPEVRSGITQNPSGTGPSAFSTLASEWIVYPVDTFAYLGSHNLSRRNISYIPGYQDLNVGSVTSYVVTGLDPDSDYLYVVRAVNANGSSSNSNQIEVFTQVISTPTVQARQLAGAVTNDTITLEWIPGNGSKRIVVMNTVNFFNTPANGSDPVANPVYGGSGQQVVYNGSTQIIEDMPFNGVLVEGLTQDTTYHFRVFEYNGFGSYTMYLSSTASGNPAQFTTLSGGFTGYYENIDGYGVSLKADLHDLLRTTHRTRYSYDALWTQLRYTDEDPANSNNIIQVYTGWSVPKTSSGGGVTQWNREHTWSKSHGDFGDVAPAGTDLHHLRPCDATVNSAKGNKDFDNGGTLYVDASPYPGYSGNTGNYTTTYTWEPRDEEKGDVARMMMYMAVRYEGTDTSYDLELVDYTNTAPNGQPFYGKLSTLLQWHEQDPPDAWELRRNERIAERQGNRNPFVDYPEFAYMLWTPYPRGATAIGTNGFTLNWSQPITGNTYYLQVARDPGFTNLVSGYSNYNAGTSTSKVISGLSAGTTYYYRLRTFFGSGYSMFSPVYTATTISPDPQPTTATISVVGNNVVLQITPIPGVPSYRVFAGDNPYGEFGDVSTQGSFNGFTWISPIGELPKRFYRVYGVWE